MKGKCPLSHAYLLNDEHFFFKAKKQKKKCIQVDRFTYEQPNIQEGRLNESISEQVRSQEMDWSYKTVPGR